ncbi:conserved hypothetical protein [Candidatus Desulfosporosinus infrequens]|uniref:Uncharacterized protein n=1 Tax=Candidatus Desulfosporosinus infrequens TaxID=2043169 RepID=A0A2U3KNH6_9FIRM|nr:conserved hypothetical protein [Candidatus Desulfosporosinus infrequens]
MIDRPFRPPTDYYCESLAPIDEQICALLAKRKEVFENNPGFPHLDIISSWCKQYELREDFVRRVFAGLYHEYHHFSLVVPTEFIRFVYILKSEKIGDVLYTIPYTKQYKNASRVYVETEVDTDDIKIHFELFISLEHECRPEGGIRHNRNMLRTFVVTPPLPDDMSGVEFHLTIKPTINPHRVAPEMQVVAMPALKVTIK